MLIVAYHEKHIEMLEASAILIVIIFLSGYLLPSMRPQAEKSLALSGLLPPKLFPMRIEVPTPKPAETYNQVNK